MTDKASNLTNKILIRARILSAIVNMQVNSSNSQFIKNEIEELCSIEDKNAVMDILLKEFLKENPEIRDYTIGFLMKEVVPNEIKEQKLYECLSNPKINDNLKTKVVSILRECGQHIKYEQYTEYFQDPDAIIDSDTEKLLENAKINPESQIDFLDFLSALPMPEKEMLLNSLQDDYDGDNLANILIPVILSNPCSEIAQIAINAIGATRSPLAYPVLENLINIVDDAKVKSNLQKSLSLLKLSGIKEDTTKEYYKKLLAYCPVYNCSISFPDGHGNIGLIFSRKNEVDFIRMFALVLNDTDGIVDCFGFNEITNTEYSRILMKFYQNNDVVEISPQLAKYLMVSAENLTRNLYGEVPYEYIVWKSITKDIEYDEIDIKENLEKYDLSTELLEKLYEKTYFDTWFMTEDENEMFAQVLKKITEEKISDVEEISSILKDSAADILSKELINRLNDRLVTCAYFAQKDERDADSKLLYSLSFDGEFKNKFLSDYLKKSVYQYFLNQKEKYASLQAATSIFTRKRQNEDIDIDFIELCIKNIEAQWV